jgi:hypothetical protein
MLNPLGYWMSSYNYGFVLMPTVDRPDIAADEQQGGLLNSHDIGLQLDGDNIGKLNLGYKVFLGNGTSSTDNMTLVGNGINKAVTANLKIEPIENIRLILSGSTDFVVSGTPKPQFQGTLLSTNLRQNILNFSVVHMTSEKKLEMASEIFYINNNFQEDSIGIQNSMAGYLYTGYKLGKITPYVRYNILLHNEGEAYFRELDYHAIEGGLKRA